MSTRKNFIGISMRACACVLLCSSASAQSTGKLRLMVDPGHDFAFVLDGKHRMQSRELDLLEGNHRLQIWAPTRTIVDTTVYVRGGSTRELLIRLPFSPEYRAHEEELRKFRGRLVLQKALPTVVTVGAGAWTLAAYLKYAKAGKQLDTDEELYRTSADPAEIAELKYQSIPEHQDDFKKANTMLIISGSVFALAAAGTIWSYLRAGNAPAPTFDDKERVRFDGLVWVPSADGHGTWLAGLTLPLR
ncbi:MAG: hypothetical protein IPG10_15005 [Flavobacteriales bacterium]|nr:hypothetical protein [Flavobacteriales bacterium]